MSIRCQSSVFRCMGKEEKEEYSRIFTIKKENLPEILLFCHFFMRRLLRERSYADV